MDIKFTITCQKCKCKTELTFGSWEGTDLFYCPCCRTQMSPEMFRALKDVSSDIAILKSVTKGFSVEISYPPPPGVSSTE